MSERSRLRRLVTVYLCLAVLMALCFSVKGSYAASPTPQPLPKNVIGYFAEWSIYEGMGFYEVSKIPWESITHINYAFAKIQNGKIAVFDAWAAEGKVFNDDPWDTPYKGNFGQLKKYKEIYPHVKTLISVGGWTQSIYFSDVALTASSREIFADSCVEFIRKYEFDGVDIDWEYPVSGGLPSNVYRQEDKQNFTYLLKTLRTKLDEAGTTDGKKYLLTIAASAGYSVIANTEPDKYHQYLDFINLMTYDYNGAWDTTTNHLAPLYSNPDDPSSSEKKEKFNTDWSVNEYLRLGVPSYKLNIGVPYYSRGWKDVSGGTNGLFGTTTSGAPMGIWDDSSSGATGTNPFSHMKSVLESSSSGFIKFRDPYAKVPYLFNPDTKVFYTYDDEESVAEKCNYVKDKDLGGVMFWEFSGDTASYTLTGLIYDNLKAPASTVTYGDVNGDGNTNSIDFAYMRQYLLGMISSFPSDNGLKAADVNEDDTFNSIDFAYMRQFLLGMIDRLPASNE